jgi:hypothetical protein
VTSSIPLRYEGGGEFRAPSAFVARLCDRDLVVGEILQWTVAEDERTAKSHKHFFATVKEAWKNLPETFADKFPNPESLRKFCLIEASYCTVTVIEARTNLEAVKTATLVTMLDEHARCEINDRFVTIKRAESQNMRAMKKDRFQASKDAVFTILSQLIGTDVAALRGVESA